MALILLDIVGFNSGDNNSTFVLFWLSFIYGGLPIILKIVSIYLMWDFKLDRKAHAEISLKLKNLRIKN